MSARFPLLLSTALLAASASAQTPITLDQSMAHPDWIGTAVESAWWSADSRSILYRQKLAGSPVRGTFRIDPAGGAGVRVDQRGWADVEEAAQGFDRERRRAVFVRQGDVFLRDLGSGRLQQLTRSAESESAAMFASDSRRVLFRRGNDWFAWNGDGLIEPVLQLKAENDPDKAAPANAGTAHELRLITTLARQKAEREALKADREARRSGDGAPGDGDGPWITGDGCGKGGKVGMPFRRGDVTAETGGKGLLQTILRRQAMQDERHIGPAHIGPVGDFSGQNAGKIGRGYLCNGIVGGHDRNEGIQREGAFAKVRLGGGGQDQFGTPGKEGSAGLGCGQGLEAELCEDLFGCWVCQPGDAVLAYRMVKTPRGSEGGEEWGEQAVPRRRLSYDPNGDAWRGKVGATGAVTDDALSIHGQKAILCFDAIEFAVPTLQRAVQGQPAIPCRQANVLRRSRTAHEKRDEKRRAAQHHLHEPCPATILWRRVSCPEADYSRPQNHLRHRIPAWRRSGRCG